MNGCLSDYELWMAHEGEARSGDLAHLGVCSACAARRERLARDVKAISHALRGAAPRSRRRGPAVRRRWGLAAAVAAGVVLLAGVEMAMWRHSNVIVEPSRQGSLETTALLDDVAAMLSSVDAVSLAALPSEDTGLGDELESVGTEETGMADVGVL
jgi:type VI protein secretion system component VasF